MIEYSIEELKYYYNKYDNDNVKKDEMNEIDKLENTLSNIIDYDYTHNNIYHIFPVVVCSFITSLLIGCFIAVG